MFVVVKVMDWTWPPRSFNKVETMDFPPTLSGGSSAASHLSSPSSSLKHTWNLQRLSRYSLFISKIGHIFMITNLEIILQDALGMNKTIE